MLSKKWNFYGESINLNVHMKQFSVNKTHIWFLFKIICRELFKMDRCCLCKELTLIELIKQSFLFWSSFESENNLITKKNLNQKTVKRKVLFEVIFWIHGEELDLMRYFLAASIWMREKKLLIKIIFVLILIFATSVWKVFDSESKFLKTKI